MKETISNDAQKDFFELELERKAYLREQDIKRQKRIALLPSFRRWSKDEPGAFYINNLGDKVSASDYPISLC